MSSIADRLRTIRERIERAALEVKRDPREIRLIAVSKLQPSAAIRAAYAEGVRDFGENYVQELVRKSDELGDLTDLRFHLIGHLQTNKAKQIAGRVSMVHSIDSPRLAEELGKRCQTAIVPAAKAWPVGGQSAANTAGALPVLVEVNTGGEAQKTGCNSEQTADVVAAIQRQSNLRVVGLMTVPPFFEDPALSRPYFDKLRHLRDTLGGRAVLPELSMGMTLDLEQAIASGATLVRVGTAIFGERQAREVP